jgi:hypothetical protein
VGQLNIGKCPACFARTVCLRIGPFRTGNWAGARVRSFDMAKAARQMAKFARFPFPKTTANCSNSFCHFHLTTSYHTKHIDEQYKKISNNIALLRRAKSFVPEHILNKMYNAFVIPNFYYCSTVWNDGYKSKLTKLSKLQKKAARVITGASYDVSDIF